MQTMTEQKKRYTILGIFVAMFLFGAFFLRETGVYFDEHSEEEILYMNILQYGETLQISKITNWFQWKDGYRPICESIERDHGSAPYYLCVPLLMKLGSIRKRPGCRVMYGMRIRMRCFSWV